jgi:hypothetical protein
LPAARLRFLSGLNRINVIAARLIDLVIIVGIHDVFCTRTADDLILEAVILISTDVDFVEAAACEHRVVAVSTAHHVTVGSTAELVVACSTEASVVAKSTSDLIVAASTGEEVILSPARDNVVAAQAEDKVLPTGAGEGVVLVGAQARVICFRGCALVCLPPKLPKRPHLP